MTAPECNRMRRFAWLALLLTACGTAPETEPVLDFEFTLEEINDRTGALYYRMTPTHDGSPVDWTDVLRTGQCFFIDWESWELVSATEGQQVLGGYWCHSPIRDPEWAVAETFLTHPAIDLVANWIKIRVRVDGEGSHDTWHECWFHEDQDFRECRESPIDDGL